jgi:CDP-paratose 2-epimerase
MNILITGSAGLIGSEAALYFAAKGHVVIGVDNDLRKRHKINITIQYGAIV